MAAEFPSSLLSIREPPNSISLVLTKFSRASLAQNVFWPPPSAATSKPMAGSRLQHARESPRARGSPAPARADGPLRVRVRGHGALRGRETAGSLGPRAQGGRHHALPAARNAAALVGVDPAQPECAFARGREGGRLEERERPARCVRQVGAGGDAGPGIRNPGATGFGLGCRESV